MPSFQDSAVIFFLALLLFGPKKLPELARQLGKLMGEFRRASSEFRLQMEDELRASEQEERRKQIAAIETAAPKPVAAAAEITSSSPAAESTAALAESSPAENSIAPPAMATADAREEMHAVDVGAHPHEHLIAPAPAPIATSGDLSIMPPVTGLPVSRNGKGSPGSSGANTSAPAPASADLAPAFAAIPHAETVAAASAADSAPAAPDRYYREAPTASPEQQTVTAPEPAAAQHG